MPPQAVPLDDHEAMDDEFEIHEDGHGDGPGNPQEDELMSDVGELVDAASALDEIGAEVEGPGEGVREPPPELPEPAAGSAAEPPPRPSVATCRVESSRVVSHGLQFGWSVLAGTAGRFRPVQACPVQPVRMVLPAQPVHAGSRGPLVTLRFTSSAFVLPLSFFCFSPGPSGPRSASEPHDLMCPRTLWPGGGVTRSRGLCCTSPGPRTLWPQGGVTHF